MHSNWEQTDIRNIENYFNSIDKPTAAYVRCASDLKMTGRTKTSINLSWKNNATESDQIVLEQSIDGGTTFTTCATLQARCHFLQWPQTC